MKKLVLLVVFIVAAYLIDLFFHVGYIVFILNLVLKPTVIAAIFFILIAPYYCKTFNKITALDSAAGIKTGGYYYLDKITSSLLVIASSFIIIFIVACVLTGGMFIYALYVPGWWLVMLIPAVIPEVFLLRRKLKKRTAAITG